MSKIQKNEIIQQLSCYDTKIFNETSPTYLERLELIPDWDDVVEYYWSLVRRFPHTLYNTRLPEYLKERYEDLNRSVIMWSYDYNEVRELKNNTFMHSHEIVLNMKFSNGDVLRLGDTQGDSNNEIEEIISLFMDHSINRYFELNKEEDPLF